MHIGGSLANDVVRGDVLSAFGQGVSPVRVAPAGTDTGVEAAVVVGVAPGTVVDDDVELELFLPPPRLDRMRVPTITTARTAPTMPRFWSCRRRWARPSWSWRSARPLCLRARFA